ncbi:UspA [Corchorus capsularis]|uniref:RING-type E3 ubiquitin transferase n=1 Tax=Corchorus capsularis TaxID=210143 RepID=A0A1R3G5B4_COCAP|nr:UspA [Corchorus capsularis]
MIHTRELTNGGQRIEGRERLVAVAVDRDKSSQRTLKWATENFITRGQTVKLVHVLPRQPSSIPNPADHPVGIDENPVMDLFLPFRCYCTRRQIHCEAVVLEDPDVAKALIEYVTHCGIETLLLGSPSKSGFSRLFKATDIPSSILKWAPDFCNVYVISKGKVSAARTATRPVPNIRADGFRSLQNNEAPSVIENDMYDEMGALEDQNDVSWASTGSWASDSSFVSFYETLLNPHNMDPNARRSTSTNPNSSTKPRDIDAATIPSSSECLEDTNDEMRRLRIELKQTMDMYHAACKEALAAKQKELFIK